jgi:hypothetical protein
MTFQEMHIHPMGYAKLFTLYTLRAQSSKKHRTGAEAPLNRISYSIRRNSLDQVDHSKTVPALVEQLQRIPKPQDFKDVTFISIRRGPAYSWRILDFGEPLERAQAGSAEEIMTVCCRNPGSSTCPVNPEKSLNLIRFPH